MRHGAKRWRLVAAGWLACGVLVAQDPTALQLELQKATRELLETSARGARLIELRVRHELGLKVDAETHWQLSEAERVPARADLEQQLEREQQELQRLVAQEDSLRRMLDQRRLRAIDLAETRLPPDAGLEPAARSTAPLPGPEPARTRGTAAGAGTTVPGTAANAALPASRPSARREDPPHGPASLILGSTDHGAVGRALFLAQRYEEAQKELELVAGPDARLVDLFQLARCHERLGSVEEARKLYLTIEARDTRTGDTAGGPWAQAARSARRAMSWVQDRGDWKPSITLDPAALQKPAPKPAPPKTGAVKRS